MWLLYISFSFRAGLLHAFLFFIRLTWWRGLISGFVMRLAAWICLVVCLCGHWPFSLYSLYFFPFFFFFKLLSSSKVSASLFCSLSHEKFSSNDSNWNPFKWLIVYLLWVLSLAGSIGWILSLDNLWWSESLIPQEEVSNLLPRGDTPGSQ